MAGFDVVRDALAVPRHIGLVFQDPTLDDYLTAEENLRFHAQPYRVPGSQIGRRPDEVLEMVELDDRRHSLVRTFSGGMKRRLEIARGLMHSPQVLFLDEPTVGLDPQTRSHIWSYINELRVREQITMFLTTHYMDEAENCERLEIIDHGALVATGSPRRSRRQLARTGSSCTSRPGRRDRRAAGGLRNRGEAERGEGRLSSGRRRGVRAASARPAAHADPLDPDRSPTLDDVFMSNTGRTIRDAEASSAERMRSRPMARARMGR